MSYSEVCGLIEEIGYEKAFELIYKTYVQSKQDFLEKEKAYLEAKGTMDHDMYAAKMFMQVVGQRGLSNMEDGFHIVRRIVGDEVVYFKSDGHTYAIGYDQITSLASVD